MVDLVAECNVFDGCEEVGAGGALFDVFVLCRKFGSTRPLLRKCFQGNQNGTHAYLWRPCE